MRTRVLTDVLTLTRHKKISSGLRFLFRLLYALALLALGLLALGLLVIFWSLVGCGTVLPQLLRLQFKSSLCLGFCWVLVFFSGVKVGSNINFSSAINAVGLFGDGP